MIEKQGRKQIEAVDEKPGEKIVKFNAFAEKEEQCKPLDKQEEIFHKLVVERTEEIEKLIKMLIFKIWYIILMVPLKI